MNEYNKYAALANTIKIEDITSCERKQDILQRLKENDEDFTKLWICTEDQIEDEFDYDPNTSTELAWLGYYLGCNSTMKELCISRSLIFDNSGTDIFRIGLGNNKSIHLLKLECFDLHDWESVLPMLDQFMKNDNKLTEINVNGCQVGTEGIRQLSLAISDCNQSLKQFCFWGNTIEDGQLVDIITSLSMHPQLETLRLRENENIGRNECTALSTLLRCTTNKLQKLSLYDGGIDDEGLEVLTNALYGHALRFLDLGHNRSITIKGWKAVATLLEAPGSKLKAFLMEYNNVGNDGAQIFANALANNSTLKTLYLEDCRITDEGWAPFSKLLCDTTYLSNHTIKHIRGANASVNINLVLNKSSDDRRVVAMSKILQRHSHFEMQPFFEWEFRVLPIMVKWFAKAVAWTDVYVGKINNMKLSVVYDFIKEFPMLYIESVTRKEIAKYNAVEEQLRQGDQVGSTPGQLEEIRCCKTRAMRRL